MRTRQYCRLHDDKPASLRPLHRNNQALEHRVSQHKTKALAGFTSRYGADSLVYFEETSDAYAAIAREKQIKGWTRAKKIALIESVNPKWTDLSEAWVPPRHRRIPSRSEAIPATGLVVAQNDTGVSHV